MKPSLNFKVYKVYVVGKKIFQNRKRAEIDHPDTTYLFFLNKIIYHKTEITIFFLLIYSVLLIDWPFFLLVHREKNKEMKDRGATTYVNWIFLENSNFIKKSLIILLLKMYSLNKNLLQSKCNPWYSFSIDIPFLLIF